jgi:dienelactone hydrolase
VRKLLGALLVLVVAVAACAPPTSAEEAARIRCGRSTKPFGIGKTTASIPVGSGRSLATTILYPSVKGTSGTDARPACGRFPLVLVAHGSQGTGASAADLHAYLVRSGYVLAAPTFTGGFDLTRLAGDASRVISGVLARDHAGTLPFSGHLRRSRIGLTGTSMGGMIGLTMYRRCCLDRRVDAVIAKLATGFGAGYRWRAGPPLLMLNGTADTTVPYADAVRTYGRAKRPKGLITLQGIGHDLAVGGDTILQESSFGFFARYLKGQSGGLRRLQRAVRRSPIATLRHVW